MKQAAEVLQSYFGYKSFRPMQEEIIESLLAGKDAMVLMPTGGGKSLCYQIPALVKPGMCIVVSPLIALMKDQVQALQQNGISAAFINSSQSSAEQQEVSRACMRGDLKLLYVSPEKLGSASFQDFLRSLEVNLFAVDEAHCISFWGHDFRPEYSQLRLLKAQYPKVPIVALTATADKITRADILEQLQLKDPEVFIRSFDRPNIRIEVQPANRRLDSIVRYVKKRPNDTGIIYCLSRKSTERVAARLRKEGVKAEYYHAHLSPAARSRVQNAFLRDDLQVVCATVAFGMGIDKSNVRFVLHHNLPKNIESYYQEIGRAGRDGLESEAILYYSFSDFILHQRILEEEASKMQDLKMEKLLRLKELVESPICRRRVLLNYFGEPAEEDCGNCDVCSNPPETFDGTLVTQMALSAVARAKERVPMTTIVEVLRGMQSQRVRELGLDNIKTFGVGRDFGDGLWRSYLSQMWSQGFLEIAYNQHNALKLTEQSHKVLFENKKVELFKPDFTKSGQKAKQPPKLSKTEQLREELFQVLRTLRKQLADAQDVPPYVVFNDKTLKEMVNSVPLDAQSFAEVSGVGQRKLAMYGTDFMEAIAQFLLKVGTRTFRGTSPALSYYFFQKGKKTAWIAHEREVRESTIYNHLETKLSEGFEVDLRRLYTDAEQAELHQAFEQIEREDQELKPIFEALEERYSYGQLSLFQYALEQGLWERSTSG